MTRKSFLSVIGGSLVAAFATKAKAAQPVTIKATTIPGKIPHDIRLVRYDYNNSGSQLFALMCQMEQGAEFENSYQWFNYNGYK